jgi:hypothetical protein
MDSSAHETPWQGVYYVRLNKNVLLSASSDRYLESVLRRVDEAPAERALPDNLPEWKHIDFGAPVWIVRHVPQDGQRTNLVGAATTFTTEGFRVAYLATPGSAVNIKSLQKEWLPESIFNTQRLRDQLKMVPQPDRTVILSCGVKPGEDTLWFSWCQLYRLQAFELFLDDR